MRGRLALALFVAATVLVAPAAGHVTVAPVFVALGKESTLEFDAPNERGVAMTSLELEVPSRLEVVALGPSPTGWRGRVDGDRVRWSDGRLAPRATALFPLRVRATGAPGSVTFRAIQHFEDGATVRWETTLSVLPGGDEAAPQQHLGRAVLAAVVGLGIIASSLLLLHRTRRRPLQEE